MMSMMVFCYISSKSIMTVFYYKDRKSMMTSWIIIISLIIMKIKFVYFEVDEVD